MDRSVGDAGLNRCSTQCYWLCVVAMQGCYEQLEVWIKQHSTIMIILGFGIATVQVRHTCVHDDCDDKSCHIYILSANYQ